MIFPFRFVKIPPARVSVAPGVSAPFVDVAAGNGVQAAKKPCWS
jgi:hypothetical protein